MPERPPIVAIGIVRAELRPDLLYEIEMPNGYRALAVVPKAGPLPPPGPPAVGRRVTAAFSPFEMSSSRILSWETSCQD